MTNCRLLFDKNIGLNGPRFDLKHKVLLWLLSGLLGALLSTSSFAKQILIDPNPNTYLDQEVRSLIHEQGLTGDPAAGRQVPSIHSPLAQLGKLLFFNKGLGGAQDTACVSCHHPFLGGGDNLSLSIGVDALNPDQLGPGRVHPSKRPTVPRNAPSTFNSVLWDEVQFWDGRVESLTKVAGANGRIGGIRTPDSAFGQADPLAGSNLIYAQARFPITSKDEMRQNYLAEVGTANQASNQLVREHLAGRLGGYLSDGSIPLQQPEYWIKLFSAVYGGSPAKNLITEQRIAEALSEYERSQLFVNNGWNRYVKGDVDAISSQAKRGALLFYRPYAEGGANCVTCHRGDKFTDEQFYNLAVPQLGVGGRGGANNSGDIGRAMQTHEVWDYFKFRTPSLLNVARTAPYTHTGAYLNLQDVIRHHLNPAWAIQHYQLTPVALLNPGIATAMMQRNTSEALYYLQREQNLGRTPLHAITLSAAQIDSLVAFLSTLTDPCITSAECLKPWIDCDDDPNKLELKAVLNQQDVRLQYMQRSSF